jgi:hypothetical protein
VTAHCPVDIQTPSRSCGFASVVSLHDLPSQDHPSLHPSSTLSQTQFSSGLGS